MYETPITSESFEQILLNLKHRRNNGQRYLNCKKALPPFRVSNTPLCTMLVQVRNLRNKISCRITGQRSV